MVLHARDLMVTEILTADRTTTVAEAARRMAERHLGYVVVLDAGRPWGIATEWDFLAKVLAVGSEPGQVVLGSIASSPVLTMDADVPTDELVATMAAKGVRRILLTSKGQIVGAVSSKQVVRAFQQYVDQISADIARLHLPSM